MGEKKSTGLVTLLIVFAILTVALGGYIVYDKVINKNSTNNSNNVVNNCQTNSENISVNTNSSVDVSSVTTEIQSVYDKAYDTINSELGFGNYKTVNIKVGDEGTVGGVIDAKARKIDFKNLEPYFTERAISFMKVYFTDTSYGHKDGNYYIFYDKNIYSNDTKKEIGNTIFGTTDQSKRKFKIKFYDDNMVVAVSEKTSFIQLDEYIVFKKVNNSWKIDMFEEF